MSGTLWTGVVPFRPFIVRVSCEKKVGGQGYRFGLVLGLLSPRGL